MSSSLVCIGKIITAHGIRGQVKLRSFTENPWDIATFGVLTDKQGNSYTIRITGGTGEMLIAAIEGIEDRTVAESLKGRELFVSRDILPETGEEEFYYTDLIGLTIKDLEGTALGTIKALHDFGAGDVVEVLFTATGKTDYYPFTKEIFPHIAVNEGFVTYVAPDMMYVKEEDNH